MENPTYEAVEHRDSLDHLRSNGFGAMIDALGNQKSYKANGTINLSALARRLRMSPKKLNDMLGRAQQFLESGEISVLTQSLLPPSSKTAKPTSTPSPGA